MFDCRARAGLDYVPDIKMTPEEVESQIRSFY
jgi:hypothetical protein